jgi:hypothetical protein
MYDRCMTQTQSTAELAHLTPVKYHGSLTEVHGEWMIVGRCWCPDCEDAGTRRELGRVGSTQRLKCVRAESFTPVGL